METVDIKKPWYKKWWGMLIIFCTWGISLPILGVYLIWNKSSWNKEVKISATMAILIICIGIPVLVSSQKLPNTEQRIVQRRSKKPFNMPSPEVAKPVSSSDPVSKIENAIKAIGDFDVTIWTADKNLADEKSKPPFEIIVNASDEDIQNCFDAKNKAYRVMEVVYSNNDIRGTVARVKFNAWGQLQVSLGEKDIGDHWNGSGPSNFWKVLLRVKSYEDEIGPLNLRTYGVRLNKDCN